MSTFGIIALVAGVALFFGAVLYYRHTTKKTTEPPPPVVVATPAPTPAPTAEPPYSKPPTPAGELTPPAVGTDDEYKGWLDAWGVKNGAPHWVIERYRAELKARQEAAKQPAPK